MAVLLVAFVVGMLAERMLGLTEPVSNAVMPLFRTAGAPLMWMAAGVAVGIFGLGAFRRLRGEEAGETGTGGPRRRSGRF